MLISLFGSLGKESSFELLLGSGCQFGSNSVGSISGNGFQLLLWFHAWFECCVWFCLFVTFWFIFIHHPSARWCFFLCNVVVSLAVECMNVVFCETDVSYWVQRVDSFVSPCSITRSNILIALKVLTDVCSSLLAIVLLAGIILLIFQYKGIENAVCICYLIYGLQQLYRQCWNPFLPQFLSTLHFCCDLIGIPVAIICWVWGERTQRVKLLSISLGVLGLSRGSC